MKMKIASRNWIDKATILKRVNVFIVDDTVNNIIQFIKGYLGLLKSLKPSGHNTQIINPNSEEI